MGYQLRREVRDALPPGLLTAAERLLVLELADICSDETREGWPGAEKLAALTDLSERSIQETMARVSRKWIELRVPLGVKNGKPVFAYSGRRTTYRFPKSLPAEGATDRGALGATDPGPSVQKGAMDPGERCDGSVEKVRQIRGPSPQGTTHKTNTSTSLSCAHEDPSPQNKIEREAGSSLEPITENPPLRFEQQLIAKRGVTGDALDFVCGWIETANTIDGPGWWVTADRNGTLDLHIRTALAAFRGDPYATPPAPNQRASPADQAVANGQRLYAKSAGSQHQPYRNPPLELQEQIYDTSRL